MGVKLLKKLGYQVTGAFGSLEALELFQVNPREFDLVITDQTMPDMTGAQMAKNTLQIRPDLPIILCTGFSENITRENAHEMGIREVVTKPITKAIIAEAIRNVLTPEFK